MYLCLQKTIKWESWRAYHRRTADTEQTRSSGDAMDETLLRKIYENPQYKQINT